MKKPWIFFCIILLTAAVLPLAAAPARDLGAFSNVRTGAARMPFYKNNQLEFYLRSQSMAMRGKHLEAVWPLIDAIRKGIPVEQVSLSDNSTDVYSLNAPLAEVTAFWANRAYSEGVVLSENALFDQAHRVASGKEKVYLRSPMLDLNGVGFSADLTARTVTVNSEVEIVLRNNGSRSLGSPLQTIQGSGKKNSGKTTSAEKTVTSTRAFCNELILDMGRNLIILNGNVRIFDPAGTITAQRLEIEITREQPKQGKKSRSSGLDAVSNSGQKLKLARFIGKVHAERKLNEEEALQGEQYAEADLMVYTAAADTLELTGSRPRLVRGKDTAEAERIVAMPEKKLIRFFDKCRFVTYQDKTANAQPDVITADYADWNHPENLIRLIGNAHLHSPSEQADVKAGRLEVYLSKDSSRSQGVKKSGNPFGGSSRPEKITASGNVQLKRMNQNVTESAVAGRMVYWGKENKITLEDKPILQRNEDIIRGGGMVYYVDDERLTVDRGSHITLSGATVGSGDIPGVPGAEKPKSASAKSGSEKASPITVDSKFADLNYGGNLIAFAGSVSVRGRGMLLDSDTLDIYLKDVPAAPGKSKDKKRSGALSGRMDTAQQLNRKQPVRALALGNVHAEDKSGTLDSGTLDVYFGDKAVPGKVEVEKIMAGKKVRIESKAEANKQDRSGKTLLGQSADGTTSLTADHGTIDLLVNQADFYEKVVVSDNSSKLECEHLQALARKTTRIIPSIESFRSRDEFPDQLAVGEGRELLKIIGDTDVKMSRTLPSGEVQRARGDHAEYVVRERTVVMTCQPPRRPQAITADGGMTGDKVTINLDSEELSVENGDVLARID